MKIGLILIICSSVHYNCLSPIEYNDTFTDWYTCMDTGYTESRLIMKNIGVEKVNKEELFTRFACFEIPNSESET